MDLTGNDSLSLPRGLVIAAPRSGSGKTLLTLGLMRAFKNAGLRVGGAKSGPDYIDPAFHAAASGETSFNLDSWAMPPALLESLAATAGAGRDIVICEGAMGLFDGAPEDPGRAGSSADVAAALGWPVLLVVDVSGQAQTAAAIVKGCANYDSRIEIAGVVLNRIGSERHRRLAAGSIEALGIRVFGALPRAEAVRLPERHLGLVQAGETEGLDALLDAMADFVRAHADLDAILASARAARRGAVSESRLAPPAQRIAIARDDAFTFLYPHILSGWRAGGAEIDFFSPLAGEPPPEHCDLCWLPGGYPELHGERLAASTPFFDGLRRFAETKPVHGECGGFIALGQYLTDKAGKVHRMAGLLGPSFRFDLRSLHLGYRDARVAALHPLGAEGARLRGHEFHYATLVEQEEPDAPFAFVRDAHGGPERPDGSRRGLVTGGFFHVIANAEG